MIKGILKIAATFCALLSATAFAQLDGSLTRLSSELKEIGTLKNLSSKEIKASKLGIGFETLDRKVFDPAKFYEKVGSIGVKWARCQTGWARTETQKGKYDFKWLDDVVDNLLAQGVQPWFNVGYGNPIYMGKVDNDTAVGYVPIYYGEECMQAWKNYVRALAEHFKGRVDQYEIWNEADINVFWQPKKASPEEYGKLIEITAKEILAVDPKAKIGACTASPLSPYTCRLYATDGFKLVDFISLHPYCLMPELNYPSKVKTVRALVKANGGKAIVREGETGFPAKIPAQSWVAKWSWHPSDESIQAKWMLRRYMTDLSLDLEMSQFFMVTDFTASYQKAAGGGIKEEAVWGVFENVGDCRPRKVYYAMRNICSLFDCSVKVSDKYYAEVNLEKIYPVKAQVSRLGTIATAAVSAAFERNGYPMISYYLPEDLQLKSGIVEGVSVYVVGDKKIENPVLVDFMTGKLYSVGNMKKLPITDYPLIVADRRALDGLIVEK